MILPFTVTQKGTVRGAFSYWAICLEAGQNKTIEAPAEWRFDGGVRILGSLDPQLLFGRGRYG